MLFETSRSSFSSFLLGFQASSVFLGVGSSLESALGAAEGCGYAVGGKG